MTSPDPDLFRFFDVPTPLQPYLKRTSYTNRDYIKFKVTIATGGYVFLNRLFRGTERSLKAYIGDGLLAPMVPINAVCGHVTVNDIVLACEGPHNQLVCELAATSFFEFFHVSGQETVNRMLDIAELAPELNTRMNQLRNYGDDTTALLADLPAVFEPLIEQRRPAPDFVHELVERIERSRGMLNLTDTYRELGHSARHIGQTFFHIVGLRPKQFARARQFQYAIELLMSGKFDTLTEIAFDAGFSDQPYFTRTLRDFIAVAPTQVLQNPDFQRLKEWMGADNQRPHGGD